jgi:hypothetical protein
MSSGSKKQEPRYAIPFSLKSPSKQTPLQVPQQGPYGATHTQGLFYISFKFLIKISLHKEIFPFSQRPQERSILQVPQKWDTYGNRRPFLEPYLAYPSESPIKEPSFQVPLTELQRREMPHP